MSSETLGALMQQASFGRVRFDNTNPFGQNSNFDNSDINRQFPDFAAPQNKGRPRPEEIPDHLPDDYVPLKVRNAQAAIRDDYIAKIPDVRPLFRGSYIQEPIDNKKYLAPVFLVEPEFTERQGGKSAVFKDNDFGGFRLPVAPSKWPIIVKEVQDFFNVGPDCSCKDTRKPVFVKIPRV